MHSSRMRTARSLIVSPYLVVSHACPRATTHAPPQEQPRMPPLGATMHAPPEQPRTPPGRNHARPPLGGTTHTPLRLRAVTSAPKV